MRPRQHAVKEISMSKPLSIGAGCAALLAAMWLAFAFMREDDANRYEKVSEIPATLAGEMLPPVPPASAATAPPAEDDAAVIARLMEGLQSDNPQMREEGKQRLAALPYDYRDRLRRATRALFGEPRAWAEARLDEMDYHLAWEPLPVSLHVKDASLIAVTSQLQSQMSGVTLANGLLNSSLYTLDVEKKPFWEVILALHEQAPLGISTAFTTATWGGRRTLQLNDVSGRNLPIVQPMARGPILFYLHWRDMPRSPGALERVATRPDQRYVLSAMTVIDPRLLPLEFEQTFEPLVDELGHVLYTMPPNQGGNAQMSFLLMHTADAAHPAQLQLTAPADAGKQIVSVKVKVRVVIGLNSVEGDLADVENHIGEPVQLGETTTSISRFTTDSQLRMASTASSKTIKPYVVYDLYDRNNALLVQWTSKADTTRGTVPKAGGPYRLHMTAPQKSREFTVEFEARDVPLPEL